MTKFPVMEHSNSTQLGLVRFVEIGTWDEDIGYHHRGEQIHISRGWYVELWLSFNPNTLIFEELYIQVLRSHASIDWQNSRQILDVLQSILV